MCLLASLASILLMLLEKGGIGWRTGIRKLIGPCRTIVMKETL